MAKDGCWGDHLVLFAAAKRFQTPIRIISSLDREIVVHPDHALANSSSLVLGHIHEFHYVSLHPRQGKTSFPITNILFFLIMFAEFIAGLQRARSARGTEPHTHGIWSTSFRLVVT